MKLIDDKTFLETQIKWFGKQIKNITVDNWNTNSIAEKDRQVAECLNDRENIRYGDLDELRCLLNAKGLKKLSNAIASAKKRKNSTKKSLQLMLTVETIYKLETLAKNKSMSMSQYIENIANNKTMSMTCALNTEARIALDSLITYRNLSEKEILESLLVTEQTQAVKEIEETKNISKQEALGVFFNDKD